MALALVIGNSDGIGLEVTRQLLARGESCIGISRSPSPLEHEAYTHRVMDVCDLGYQPLLRSLVEAQLPDVCVFCVGIGDLLRLEDDAEAAMTFERRVFEVNLMAALRTLEVLVPAMVAAGAGHILGLSSQADRSANAHAPSYNGSKAGLSTYLEGLALALRPHSVHVTNVRFGFVDTKMAKSDVKPFMMTAQKAARLVMKCIDKRPISATYPRRMAWLMRLINLGMRARVWWG